MANPIRLRSSSRSPIFRRPAHVTVLDLDGATLRVVQTGTGRRQANVSRAAAVALTFAPDANRADPDVVGTAVAEALSQLGIKTSSVIMGVPRAQVVLRTLTLPHCKNLRELASMVHFQSARDLPFRIEDAVLDFKIIREVDTPANPAAPATPESTTDPARLRKYEVLVAAVRREVVHFHQAMASAAGLKLVALGLLADANARCLHGCKVVADDQAAALVSLRPDEVNVDIIAWQTLLFSRGGAIGALPQESAPTDPASSPSESADALAPFPTATDPFTQAAIIEVVRSLHAFSGLMPNAAVAKVAVTGATGAEAAVVEALSRRLSCPCVLLDPAAALDLPPAAHDEAAGSSAAIGLALGWMDRQGLPLDFLNPKRPARPINRGRLRLLAGLTSGAALFLALATVRVRLIQRHETTRRDVANEVAEAEKKSPIYRQMIRQAASVEEWTKERRSWLEHYAYLSAVLPPSEDLYITSLAATSPDSIRLNVQARSGEILARLDQQLRSAGYDVRPLAITPGADRYDYEFRSSVELVVPENLKVDLAKVKTPARPHDDTSLDPAVGKGGGAR